MLGFHIEFVQTDGRTDKSKTICPPHPDLTIQGHKNDWRISAMKIEH